MAHEHKPRRRVNRYIKEKVIEAWKKAHPGEDPNTRDVAIWAIKKKLMHGSRSAEVEQVMGKIRRALHDDVVTDAQGRTVRANYAYPAEVFVDGEVRQLTLWTGVDGEPDKVEKAFAWRRTSILGDCKQLKTDHDSYNDNNPHGATLEQLKLDFTDDVAESENPTDYPESRPYGEDEQDDDEDDEDGGSGVPVPV